jgi:hypothetical protein
VCGVARGIKLRGDLFDPERAQHFTWSLLRVFGSNTTPDEVDRAESHFKETLQTRKFGYNLNDGACPGGHVIPCIRQA